MLTVKTQDLFLIFYLLFPSRWWSVVVSMNINTIWLQSGGQGYYTFRGKKTICGEKNNKGTMKVCHPGPRNTVMCWLWKRILPPGWL